MNFEFICYILTSRRPDLNLATRPPHTVQGGRGRGRGYRRGAWFLHKRRRTRTLKKRYFINRNRKTPIFLLFYAGFKFFKSRVIIILWDHDNAHRDFKWLKVVSWVSEQLPRLKYRGIISNFVEITKQVYLKA